MKRTFLLVTFVLILIISLSGCNTSQPQSPVINTDENISMQNFANGCVYDENNHIIAKCGFSSRLELWENESKIRILKVHRPPSYFQLWKNSVYYSDNFNIYREDQKKSKIVEVGRFFFIVDNILYFNAIKNSKIYETFQKNLLTGKKEKLFEDPYQSDELMYIANGNIYYLGKNSNLFQFNLATKKISPVIVDAVGFFVVCGNVIFYSNNTDIVMKNMNDGSMVIIDKDEFSNHLMFYKDYLYYLIRNDLYRSKVKEGTRELISKKIENFGIINDVLYANIHINALDYGEFYKKAYLKVINLDQLTTRSINFKFAYGEGIE